ncbi:hypothetical protein BDD12DRAFT_832417 [Trichophaea hybrida]|nr:hypothetical protein BDD12DRAFT_832417 [Trichophaea hybrida]
MLTSTDYSLTSLIPQLKAADTTMATYPPVYSSPTSPEFVPPEGLQKQDLTLKLWIRILKLISRILSLACSGVVIGLSITSFQIFLSTRHLAPIDGFVPWARNTPLWPQILTLIIAIISFIAALVVILGYLFRGHRTAENLSRYTTITTILGFVAWIVIWAAAGASLQKVRDSSRGQDIWGWACAKQTKHHELFNDRIGYDLVCIMQDWNFICAIIHVGTVVFSAAVWAFALWRINVRVRISKGAGTG